MTHLFEPFTPELFKQMTGLNAQENEAIYLRWVNSQINYANYQNMREMNSSLREIIALLKEGAMEMQRTTIDNRKLNSCHYFRCSKKLFLCCR
jgi:hypothetical protein